MSKDRSLDGCIRTSGCSFCRRGIERDEPAPRAKVALVIGQQRYDAWPQTRTAERDALDVAERLTSLGFDTTLELNLTQSRHGTCVRSF